MQARVASALLQLPHLLRWYANVQEVPGVLRAAKACGMSFSNPRTPITGSPVSPTEDSPASLLEDDEGHGMLTQPAFVGGPRPTMTKLKVNNYLPPLCLMLYTSLVCRHIFFNTQVQDSSFRVSFVSPNWLLMVIPVISNTYVLANCDSKNVALS